MAGAGLPAPRQPAGRRRGWVILWVLFGVAAALFVGGAGTELATVRTFHMPSDSMDNTVRPGDELAVSTPGPVRRGEVVVEEQLPRNDFYVRRVIGLPGDHVACCDAAGRVTVNGKALHETYLPPGVIPSRVRFRVTVPRGKLWLMGDNRDVAYDSRYIGPVTAHVIGPVFLIVRSGHSIFLHTPQTFTASGLAPAGQPLPPGLIGLAVAGTGFTVLVLLLIIGAVLLVRRSRRQSSPQRPAGVPG